MVQVVDGAMTATYTYDGNGQRVKKIVNGVTTIFHYDLRGQLIAESNSSGAITAEYVYLNGQPLAKMEGASTYYYHNDHLATPQKMTDSAGTVVWAADYKPFGEATITVSMITNNLRFPGQYYDAEAGLHYNYFRDYNPITGRYIERDPIGLLGGINLYRYVYNSPVRYSDRLGLFAFGKRPLADGDAPWFGSGSDNPLDDHFNTELSHEHGFFEDGSNDNLGFGKKGRFSEDPNGKGYRYGTEHYDDSIMREALKNIPDGKYSNWPWNKNNCQDWAERLRKEYERLKKEKEKAGCKK